MKRKLILINKAFSFLIIRRNANNSNVISKPLLHSNCLIANSSILSYPLPHHWSLQNVCSKSCESGASSNTISALVSRTSLHCINCIICHQYHCHVGHEDLSNQHFSLLYYRFQFHALHVTVISRHIHVT